MYNSKSKTAPASPSDAQAKEKLASYVYEYLLHNGAPKSAEIFMREMQFDKNFHLGESPGFLSSWWSIFWDLYCSAPERRCNNPHSDEAKAFHDYGFVNGQHNGQIYMNGMHNSNAPSPLGQMPSNDGMSGGPMPPTGFFANSHMRPSPTQQPVNQPSPHSQMIQTQAFLSPRYPGAPGSRGPNVRIPQQVEFNPPPSGVPGQSMMPNNMDPNRQGPPTMQQMNPRMFGPHPPQPRVPPMSQMGSSFNCNMGQFPPSMRPPTGLNGPSVNGQNGQPNGQQMPINMPGPGGPPGGPGRQWSNNNMNYNSSSPGNHYGPPVSNSGPGQAPGTPIMPSPQGSAGPYSPASHRMGTPNTGRGSGGDGMYPIMKQVPGVNIPNFVMNDPNLQAPPTSSPLPTDPILESIKQSPGHGSQDQSNTEHNNLDYNNIVPYQENDQNESAAILKIKESMQEEAKRFEKEPSGDHNEFYIQ